MSHQQLTSVAPAAPAVPEDVPHIDTPCDENALKKLRDALAQRTPVAMLIDDGNGRAAQVLDHFVSDGEQDTDVVRIRDPFLDSITFMRQLIAGLGFQTAELSLTDLESIFRMFLSYQKTHHRRTVVCFEEAQEQGAWVLDKMCQFVEFEEQSGFGLFIVLVGRSDLVSALAQPPLDSLSGAERAIITVAPLALSDTREIVRRCVEVDGRGDVAQVFDFRAITRIHKLSAGVPDNIGSLCGECVEMLNKDNETLVTTSLVNKAAESLGLYSSPGSTQALKLDGDPCLADADFPSSGQLIVRKEGRVIQTLMVDKESILIGRDQRCDICITSPVVSRQHALIVNAPAGVKLVDLGSTNGSIVDGERVDRCPLQENEVIVIGDCRIEFVAADYGPIAFETDRQAEQAVDDDSVLVEDEEPSHTRRVAAEARPS